jgi:hypothetical protein
MFWTPACAGVTVHRAFYECINIDELVKSWKMPFSVIPAKAGIQSFQAFLDSRLRGSDDFWDFLRMHQH